MKKIGIFQNVSSAFPTGPTFGAQAPGGHEVEVYCALRHKGRVRLESM